MKILIFLFILPFILCQFDGTYTDNFHPKKQKLYLCENPTTNEVYGIYSNGGYIKATKSNGTYASGTYYETTGKTGNVILILEDGKLYREQDENTAEETRENTNRPSDLECGYANLNESDSLAGRWQRFGNPNIITDICIEGDKWTAAYEETGSDGPMNPTHFNGTAFSTQIVWGKWIDANATGQNLIFMTNSTFFIAFGGTTDNPYVLYYEKSTAAPGDCNRYAYLLNPDPGTGSGARIGASLLVILISLFLLY